MRFWTTIGLILVLSAVGLTYEIAAGRVLAPFFGTSLVTWTAVIATVLAGFSLGSVLGGLGAERERRVAAGYMRTALVATAVLMALSPTVLGLLYAWGARGTGGMLLSVFLAFFPASVLVSAPSPFLAKLAVEARPGREGSSLGLVLAAGSMGAIMGAILAGFLALPLVGSAATFAGCGAAALLCVPFVQGSTPGAGGAAETVVGREVETRSVGAIGPAALVVAMSMAGGPACQYESGLSCIDVVHVDDAVHLYSDRTRQAAERIVRSDGDPAVSHELMLPYTQWIWARMEHDLGPAPSVLFIGGGGYTLPSRLLKSRPAAQTVAVEIDLLVTRVARLHMPWAGAISRNVALVWANRPGGRRSLARASALPIIGVSSPFGHSSTSCSDTITRLGASSSPAPLRRQRNADRSASRCPMDGWQQDGVGERAPLCG